MGEKDRKFQRSVLGQLDEELGVDKAMSQVPEELLSEGGHTTREQIDADAVVRRALRGKEHVTPHELVQQHFRNRRWRRILIVILTLLFVAIALFLI